MRDVVESRRTIRNLRRWESTRLRTRFQRRQSNRSQWHVDRWTRTGQRRHEFQRIRIVRWTRRLFRHLGPTHFANGNVRVLHNVRTVPRQFVRLDRFQEQHQRFGEGKSVNQFRFITKSNQICRFQITTSPFCRKCLENLSLPNGFIKYLNNRAFHYCHEGYRRHGPSVRDCLRSSKWSLPAPTCRSIYCGYLPSLLNGNVATQKTIHGEMATYSCHENFYLVGDRVRLCQLDGKWSGKHPECISEFNFDMFER